MAIRYDEKINREINKTIKNFNQKIARLEKTERDLLLPSKITKKELKESVYTRTELKRKLKELQRFSKRGIEDTIETKSGLELSKYEYQNIKRESARLKRNVTREIHRMEISKPKIFGKEQATTFAQMGDTKYLNLKARRKALDKSIDVLSNDELKRYKELLMKTSKNKTYMNTIFKNNYMKMLTDLGYYYNYNNDKLKKLEDKIKGLKSDDFLKLFENDKSIKAILDYYPIVSKNSSINPDDVKEDVSNLYDALIDNIDEILENYE